MDRTKGNANSYSISLITFINITESIWYMATNSRLVIYLKNHKISLTRL